MTRLHRSSAIKTILAIGATLSMTSGMAFAAETNVTADQILKALQPASQTRGLTAGRAADPAAKARELQFVDTLRNRKTRSLSLGEREEISQIAAAKPKIDLEIHFDYNSADDQQGLGAGGAGAGRGALESRTQGLDLRGRRPHRRDRHRGL